MTGASVSPRLSILFVPVGSEGDVQPLVWLAKGMAARGHRITFLVNPHYRFLTEPQGWRVLDLLAAEWWASHMNNPKMWRPLEGSIFGLMMVQNSLEPSRQALDAAGEKFDLVVGTALAMGAMSWAEAQRIPRLMVHLAPFCIRSAMDCSLYLERMEWLCRAPPKLVHALFVTFDALTPAALLRPLNEYRRRLGLPRMRCLEDIWQGADGVAALFPPWFASSQRDWPPHARQFGFPYSRQTADGELPEALEQFLAAGEPPILWTHGSANADVERFVDGAREATRLLGARGVFLGPSTASDDKITDFLTLRYAPFSRLLPRCRAVVHHAGIGTCTHALAAGLPQLLVPRAHDQFDNARRLERMGVGVRLSYRHFSAESAAQRLRSLLESSSVAAACAEFRSKLLADDCLAGLCDWLEELGRTPKVQASADPSIRAAPTSAIAAVTLGAGGPDRRPD